MNKKKICAACLSAYDDSLPVCPHCGCANENTNPTGSLAAGTCIGDNYRIGAFVSIDGEGITYQANELSTHRDYLIKEYMPVTLCQGRNDDDTLQLRPNCEVPFKNNFSDFCDLYQALRRLSGDPCLQGVHDLVRQNGTAYAVIEKIEGEPLEDYLSKFGGALQWEEAADLLEPVFLAVEKLHNAGVIHRGLCPENILVSGPGIPRLTGYGTQGLRRHSTELKSQLYAGYSAPEQYDATAFDGPFTDIYSLAAVFYRTVTGFTPASARERAREDKLEKPSRLVPKLPGYINGALLCAMDVDWGRRYPDMQSFRRAMAGMKEEPARASSAARSGARTAGRRGISLGPEARIALIAGCAVLAVLLVAVLMWSASRRPQTAPEDKTESYSESLSGAQSKEELVPNFVGRTYKAVQQEYTNYLFSVEEVYSTTSDIGEILTQDPQPNTVYTPGSVIKLTVSKGAETFSMIDVEGMSLSWVQEYLQSNGISSSVLMIYNDGTWAEGYVTGADVPEGTQLRVGVDKVTLYVAKAPAVSSSSSASSSVPASSSQSESVSSSGSSSATDSSSSVAPSESPAPTSSAG